MRRFITVMLAAICIVSTAEAAKPSFGIPSKRELRKKYHNYVKTDEYYVESYTVVRLKRRDENTPKGLKSRQVVTYIRQIPLESPDSTYIATQEIKPLIYADL